MSHANNPKFKEALEKFCTEWDIDYAVLLVPNTGGDIGLMGINLNHHQIKQLMTTVLKHMPNDLQKRRLDS